MEENKYYIPEIEDLYIGYELEVLEAIYTCDLLDFTITTNKYAKGVIQRGYDIDTIKSLNLNIRVPYLTKEDIIGWENIVEIDDVGAFEATKNKKGTDYKVCWTTDNVLSVWEYGNDCIYRGDCRCINDFRLIMKLLNIK